MSEQKKSVLRILATMILTAFTAQILSIDASFFVEFVCYTLIGVSIFLLVTKALDYYERIQKRKK